MSERLYGSGHFEEVNSTGNSVGPNLHFEFEGPDSHLKNLGKKIHPINVEKGFWSEPEMMDKVAAKMMLVVTETAEVIEALRKSQGADKVTEEFSDIVIRMLDLHDVLVELGWATDDLDETTAAKIEANRNRPPKHGHRWG